MISDAGHSIWYQSRICCARSQDGVSNRPWGLPACLLDRKGRWRYPASVLRGERVSGHYFTTPRSADIQF